MKTSIELNEMRFFAYHGVGSQERRVGNDYVVSLRVDCPIEGAMESDALEDTLDYAALYALVAAEMATPSLLLEHVAGRICRALTRTFPAVSGEIRGEKKTPLRVALLAVIIAIVALGCTVFASFFEIVDLTGSMGGVIVVAGALSAAFFGVLYRLSTTKLDKSERFLALVRRVEGKND